MREREKERDRFGLFWVWAISKHPLLVRGGSCYKDKVCKNQQQQKSVEQIPMTLATPCFSRVAVAEFPGLVMSVDGRMPD